MSDTFDGIERMVREKLRAAETDMERWQLLAHARISVRCRPARFFRAMVGRWTAWGRIFPRRSASFCATGIIMTDDRK